MAGQFQLEWTDAPNNSKSVRVDRILYSVHQGLSGWWYAYKSGRRFPAVKPQKSRGLVMLELEQLLVEGSPR